MAANIVYLVKKQHFADICEPSNWQFDETIAVCSTPEKAQEYIPSPNLDTIVTEYEVDNPDSEVLLVNIDAFYRRA